MDHSQSQHEANSDSEWEYEYDENETESFYVTVEFPSREAIQPQPQVGRGGDRRTTTTQAHSSKPGNDQVQDDDVVEQQTVREDDSSMNQQDIRPGEPSIQVLDLHSKNPIISRDGQVYSCAWGRTLGTDIIFSAPGAIGDNATPLMAFDGFDMVAMSHLKLIAKPVELKPRTSENSTAGENEPSNEGDQARDKMAANGNTYADLKSNEDSGRIEERIDRSVPRASTEQSAKSNQRTLLDMFAEARRKRGQTDPILIRSGADYYVYTGGDLESATYSVGVQGSLEASSTSRTLDSGGSSNTSLAPRRGRGGGRGSSRNTRGRRRG